MCLLLLFGFITLFRKFAVLDKFVKIFYEKQPIIKIDGVMAHHELVQASYERQFSSIHNRESSRITTNQAYIGIQMTSLHPLKLMFYINTMRAHTKQSESECRVHVE